MQNQVCVIGVYFGTLPAYFSLWLLSCKCNTQVDFRVITDMNLSAYTLPDNVKSIPCTIDEMRKRASRILGFEACLPEPYKCCDFKPLYGLIFADVVKGYEYWGHCDFDLLWGDLSTFFVKYRLSDYEKFLPYGHLALYRNTLENNSRYRLSGSLCGNYVQAFGNGKHIAFDEDSGINMIYRQHQIPLFSKRIFADISDTYHRFRCAQKDRNYRMQVFYWKNGKVYRAFYYRGMIRTEEFLYIHFQKRGIMAIHGDCLERERFFITPNGFYEMKHENVELQDMKRYNPYPGLLYEKREKYRRKWREHVKPRLMRLIRCIWRRRCENI